MDMRQKRTALGSLIVFSSLGLLTIALLKGASHHEQQQGFAAATPSPSSQPSTLRRTATRHGHPNHLSSNDSIPLAPLATRPQSAHPTAEPSAAAAPTNQEAGPPSAVVLAPIPHHSKNSATQKALNDTVAKTTIPRPLTSTAPLRTSSVATPPNITPQANAREDDDFASVTAQIQAVLPRFLARSKPSSSTQSQTLTHQQTSSADQPAGSAVLSELSPMPTSTQGAGQTSSMTASRSSESAETVTTISTTSQGNLQATQTTLAHHHPALLSPPAATPSAGATPAISAMAATTATHTTGDTWQIQVASFSNPSMAKALAARLHTDGFRTATEQATTPHGTVTRVLVQRIPSRQVASLLSHQIEDKYQLHGILRHTHG